ncbi:MarR family winged helix-turn-helix transcriptional regulator [Actinomycetospora sp. TBRC 11914]|uniref:MarR family winged helix-turn-helix transcriptional regulator n=1 Tax=Actinomycetospora sp. TBRC 11914 TaxID=2729387 RepID=UPI00145CE25F|nr:MarR family transcriptional regulator [Actinomycetospora sp. TBRC 11914]NMO90469.1 MarR family transcriptional regulator [Actinomycetospora sp. TBRC 11914]
MASPPPVDLAFLVNQVSYALAARMGEALADLDLTVSQYCVLWKAHERERTQIEIAEEGGLDKSTVVNEVDKLERAGFATRRVHPTDRRARVVGVTDAGVEVLGRAHRAVAAVHDEALSDLPPDRRAAFLTDLTAVAGGVLATPSHVTALRRRRTPRPASTGR